MNYSLVEATIGLFNQLEATLMQVSDDDFQKPSNTLNSSSIGQHVRHTLEFYLCLMDASSTKTVDYDNRKHDQFIERDKTLALGLIDSIRTFISNQTDNFDLILRANYHPTEQNSGFEIPSNFFREVLYNIEHTVHHMALIKIGIKEICPTVNLDPGFGVATSTLRYQKQLK